jgi:hypothetical protein
MTKSMAACPICKKPAKQAKVNVGDYTEVRCTPCGQFQISGTLQKVISSYPVVARRQSLERGRLRARYGSVPLITTYDLP